MSSMVDALLGSDNIDSSGPVQPPASSGAGPRSQARSSSRPRAIPSESNGAHSDVERFEDDDVVGARGLPGRRRDPRTDIPKVVDVTGETLSQRFEEFLES